MARSVSYLQVVPRGERPQATYSGRVSPPLDASSDLVARLAALPLPTLVILEIAALGGAPVGLRRLIEVGRPLTAGDEFAPSQLGPRITTLIEQGWLSEDGDNLFCPSDLCDTVAVHAMGTPRAALIARQILKIEPWSKAMLRDPVALWRHFRLFLYAGDIAQAQGLATNLESLNGSKAFAEVGRHLQDAGSFLRFPPAVALEMARDTVVQSLNKPFPAPHAITAFGHLVQRPHASEKDKQLYAHVLLMTGQLEAFDDFLDSYDGPTLEGCRKLLEGNLAGLDDFERGLRQSKSFFSYTALFLYLVGLLAREGLDSPRARQEIERSLSFRTPMEWLLAVKAGEVREITLEMRRILQNPPDALVPHLCLILYWAGFRYEGLDTDTLSRQYELAGYPVFAEWVIWCGLGQLGGGRPRPPLLGLLEPGEQWRHALSSLSLWAAPYRRFSDERLVWLVEPAGQSCQLELRVQKRARKGAWSAGRLVDMESVLQAPPLCADALDRRVLDGVERLYRRQFRSASDPQVVQTALLLLVGHPRVYRVSSPQERVDVVEEPVSLRVGRFPDYLELKLDPGPVPRPTVLAQGPDLGRVRLYHYTARHVELGHMIGSGLRIPPEGEAELKETLAGLAASGLVLRSDIELAGEAEDVTCEQVQVIRLAPYGEGVSVQVRVAPLGLAGPLLVPGEGSPVVGGLVEGRGLQTRRDLEQERARFAELGFATPDFITQTARESLELLEYVATLPSDRFRVEWPEGEKMKVVGTLSSAGLGQRVRSGTDWFALSARVKVDEGTVLTLSELLRLRRQATETRFLPLSEGKYLALTAELESYLERLDRLAHKVSGQQVQLHPLVGLSLLEHETVEADAGYAALKERLSRAQDLEPELPPSLESILRPYQAEGVRWMLRLAHWGVGACLADDMGLGKTLQMLTVLLARQHEGPSLVVAPTSVCWNWQEEAARFAPSLRLRSLAEASRQAVLDELGPGDVLVCSYGLLVNESSALSAISWGTVVLDEAQAIKNAGTQRSRAACALNARFRVAASGTPVENHPEEMWSLFRFLNPGLLGSAKSYGARFAGTAGQAELARLVRPFILRRTKSQVLRELPPRTEILERVAMTEGERALYESLRRQAVDSLKGESDYVSVLAQLTRLRRVCCHPRLVMPEMGLSSSKLERFRELVEELVENGHRALVFSQFVGYLEILRSQLDAWGVSYAYLDGATSAAARKKAVRSFQEGHGDLFLISLKAGGTGLNLTGADYVIHMDPWWNPAVEDQASDRAHRMGQTRPVTVYRLVAQGTVEEQIVELHGQKRDLADRLLTGTEGSGRLSAEELMGLIGA